MTPTKYRSPPLWLIFILAAVVALGFALYTNHVWEDYYITYRSSKNLATGHGLVYNLGEKLHTFTSPLGVLLPAAASLMTGNTSDAAALWIFRVMCAAALGGGMVLLFILARRQGLKGLALLLLVAGLLSDPKTIDFTINGMETAFLLLFLAYAFWSHLTTGPRQWLHLGAAWAGLMWTRPDSFIYIGLIAVGFGLFNDEVQSGKSRGGLIRLYFQAGLVTTALYLPWLLWATAYYGTPIPHTITAKGGISEAHTLGGLLLTAVQLPYLAWFKSSSLELTFLPSYYMIGGWPQGLIYGSRLLATLSCLLWLLPCLRPWTRTASFAYFGAHVYLTYFPYFPFPWYIPSTTLLALIALCGLADWLGSVARNRKLFRRATISLIAVLLVGNAWMLVQAARQVAAGQTWVEDGTRRKIGEWLHNNAAAGDTVFMEPLGYIGFFSNLKTYDWPGMSSREMVEARQQVGSNWATLLHYLEPDWVVLRPFEVERINRLSYRLLTDDYKVAQVFDNSAKVAALQVNGLPYLEHDAHFIVYHLRRIPIAERSPVTLARDEQSLVPSQIKVTGKAYHTDFNAHRIALTGVPTLIEFPLTPDLSEVTGGFGLLDDEWLQPEPVKPVEFRVSVITPDGTEQELLRKVLDPFHRADDRGFRPFRLSLPQPLAGHLRFRTSSTAPTTRQIRAFWGELRVVPLRTSLQMHGRSIPAASASSSRFGFFNTEEAGRPCLFAHAPSMLIYDWQEGMGAFAAEFGVMQGAYSNGNVTEGVVFILERETADGKISELFRRYLDPRKVEEDRGDQQLRVIVPPTPGGRLRLRTVPPPSGHLNHAWSYWRNLRTAS
ncbi:MAG: hypothetical protein K9M98_03745 [Cephaloticoccus sp.]|nr:hypothetical protein [Cephaloticoccus sp.]MCF7759595.1 hypothetical protein [Cephaloticoccus sp.]